MYKKIWIPNRRRSYRRRFENQRKRRDTALGIIALACIGLGAGAGGWGGAAIGLLAAGAIIGFVCHNPNP